jgi:preprotein translocase subunit SecD
VPHRVWPLGALALAVLLVGCGGDEDEGASTTTASQGAGSAATGAVLFYDWEPSVVGNPELPVPKTVANERAGGKPVVILGDQETGRYWAVSGKPALDGKDVESAEQNLDSASGQPGVLIKLNGDGRARFQALTRAVARRAKSTGEQQHFAIVVGEKVVSRPFVDPQQYPNGFDAENGIEITGGYTVQEAKNLADRINAGG